jgi:hypothetical protein
MGNNASVYEEEIGKRGARSKAVGGGGDRLTQKGS